MNDGGIDTTKNKIDFRNMRAIDFAFSRRVYMPPPVERETELQLQLLKTNLQKATERYASKTTERETETLTENEKKGLVTLKERIKRGEIVVQQTDKSGRNAVDSPENYNIAVQPHTTNDIPITKEEHEELEKEINAHTLTWCKIVQIGKNTNQYDRIKNNLRTRNSEYATLSCLRKDHKTGFDTKQGTLRRPLYAGNVGYNYRSSNLLCKILREIPENEETECENTEDLLAKIDETNEERL